MSRVDDNRFFDPVIETMPREEIEQLQEARILQLLPYAYSQSALVREVWDAVGVSPKTSATWLTFGRMCPLLTRTPFVVSVTAMAILTVVWPVQGHRNCAVLVLPREPPATQRHCRVRITTWRLSTISRTRAMNCARFFLHTVVSCLAANR